MSDINDLPLPYISALAETFDRAYADPSNEGMDQATKALAEAFPAEMQLDLSRGAFGYRFEVYSNVRDLLEATHEEAASCVLGVHFRGKAKETLRCACGEPLPRIIPDECRMVTCACGSSWIPNPPESETRATTIQELGRFGLLNASTLNPKAATWREMVKGETRAAAIQELDSLNLAEGPAGVVEAVLRVGEKESGRPLNAVELAALSNIYAEASRLFFEKAEALGRERLNVGPRRPLPS